MRKILLFFAIKYKGNWDKIYDALEEKEKVNLFEVEEIYNNYKDNFIAIIDNDYPENLKRCWKPPFVLFFKGKKELLFSDQIIFFVFKNNDSSKKYAERINSFEKQINKTKSTLVFYLQNEVDKFVGKKNDFNKIFISANGIDYKLKDNEIVVSEYPEFNNDKEIVDEITRILASIANKTIVLSAKVNDFSFEKILKSIESSTELFLLSTNQKDERWLNKIPRKAIKVLNNIDLILN